MDETLVSGGYWSIPHHNLDIYVGWTKSHISYLLVTNFCWALYVGLPLPPLAHAFGSACGSTSFDIREICVWLTLSLLMWVATVE